MTDAIAIRDGFTRELIACDDRGDELHILVRPKTDLSDTFKAWDCDAQEYIRINGWLFTYDEAR